jgi:hypothetical protein
MTQNPWPQDGSIDTPTANQDATLRQPSTFPRVADGEIYGTTPPGAAAVTVPASGASTTDATEHEAAEVSRQAAVSAQNVAETAKSEAANVATEVKTNVLDLLHQAQADLTDQAGAQQVKVAEGLRSVSTELHTMASASDQPGVATDLVRQAAERSSAVAGWLDARDPGSILTEVKSFARQRPGTFLLLAAGAGILAGRLGRSLSAGTSGSAAGGSSSADRTRTVAAAAPIARVPDTGMAVTPPPVQMPAPETTTAGFAETYPPNPLTDEGTDSDQWPAPPAQAHAHRVSADRDDPVGDVPFEGGRR